MVFRQPNPDLPWESSSAEEIISWGRIRSVDDEEGALFISGLMDLPCPPSYCFVDLYAKGIPRNYNKNSQDSTREFHVKCAQQKIVPGLSVVFNERNRNVCNLSLEENLSEEDELRCVRMISKGGKPMKISFGFRDASEPFYDNVRKKLSLFSEDYLISNGTFTFLPEEFKQGNYDDEKGFVLTREDQSNTTLIAKHCSVYEIKQVLNWFDLLKK